jgi:hypothetical protein
MALAATLLATAAALPQAARAQQPVQQPAPQAVFSLPAPPPGFDPLTASAADLARYGLPARPNPLARDPAPYLAWSRAMAAARHHVDAILRIVPRRHGPAAGLARLAPGKTAIPGATPLRATPLGSTNWAGEALANGSTSFGGTAFHEIFAQWGLPSVQQAVGSCSGTDVSAIWVGIDGLAGSSDVAQAGTEGDAACAGGATTGNYYGWFEWYPADTYEILNFPVGPGSSVFVVVQIESATSASATFVNLQTGIYTSVGFFAPSGTSLKGDSAEWVVERPAINANNDLGTLSDFGMIGMTAEVAFLADSSTEQVPGSPGAGQTGYTLTMLDANNNAIASAAPQGASAQFMYVQGSTE